MRLRRRGVWLSLLSHGRLALVCRRSCQADWKTTTSRADVLFCFAASGRYRTATLWVTRLQTATLRSISRRTEHAQQHVLDLDTGVKRDVKGLRPTSRRTTTWRSGTTTECERRHSRRVREREQSRPRRRRRHRIAACLGLVPRIVCVCTRASCGLGVDAVDMRAWCRTV